MARRDGPVDDGAALREFLLRDAEDFRRLMCDLGDQAWVEYAWRECSKAVDQLAGGEDYRFAAFDLPEGHPALADYGPNADLVLTADDRLMRYEDYVDDGLADVSRPHCG